jgi:hypothetical protein
MSCETAGREIASMEGEIVHHSQGGGLTVPAIIADAGEGAAERFIEFFTANIRNPNTRAAYAQAVAQFLRWCQGRGFSLQDIKPVAVAAYIESHPGADPTKGVKLVSVHFSSKNELTLIALKGFSPSRPVVLGVIQGVKSDKRFQVRG